MQVVLKTDEGMCALMSLIVRQIREEASRESRRGHRC
jgi:hypothetical protein